MNDKYIEKLGRIICNTYGIAQHDPSKVGKLINTTYRLLEDEYIRDCREEVNKAQWDEKCNGWCGEHECNENQKEGICQRIKK